METWPNKQMKRRPDPEGFLHSMRREDPQQWGSFREGDELEFERLGAKLRQSMFRHLPEGEQPEIADVFAHTGEDDSWCLSERTSIHQGGYILTMSQILQSAVQ